MRGMVTRRSGFTVVEMLITLGILGIVIGIITTFLFSQWRLADQVEARNEMQVNLRAAMELVSTELYSAGSEGIAFECAIDWVNKPALVSTRPASRQHTLTVRYCDPYTGNPVGIFYDLRADSSNGNIQTLYRAHDTNTNDDTAATSQAAIPGIVALELEFQCDPTGATPTSGAPDYTCQPTSGSFNPEDVLSVTIKLAARSVRKTRGVESTYTFDGQALTSESGYYYEYAEQAVSPPNLRN